MVENTSLWLGWRKVVVSGGLLIATVKVQEDKLLISVYLSGQD